MDDQILKKFFEFDDDDLQANRLGNISEKQRSRLKSDVGGGRILVLIFGLAVLGGASVPMITAVRAGAATSLTKWIIAVVVLLVGLAIDGWLLRRLMMKTEYQLGKVEGRANIVTTSDDRTVFYELHLGREKFDVEEGIVDVIVQGSSYRIYYIKEYNNILSVEPLP